MICSYLCLSANCGLPSLPVHFTGSQIVLHIPSFSAKEWRLWLGKGLALKHKPGGSQFWLNAELLISKTWLSALFTLKRLWVSYKWVISCQVKRLSGEKIWVQSTEFPTHGWSSMNLTIVKTSIRLLMLQQSLSLDLLYIILIKVAEGQVGPNPAQNGPCAFRFSELRPIISPSLCVLEARIKNGIWGLVICPEIIKLGFFFSVFLMRRQLL
jgi:hypothetical protein